MGAGLLRRRGGEEKPCVEPFRHSLRRDTMRVGNEFVKRQHQSVLGEHLQESRLVLTQLCAAESLDLAGQLRIYQRLRSLWPRQEDAAFLKGFADRGDPKTQGSGVQPLAARIKLRHGDDFLIALVDAAARKYQRARVKVDLIMAHHHENLDLPTTVVRPRRAEAVAQQQDSGRRARLDEFDGHELSLLASSLILRSGRLAASRSMKRYAAHGSRRAK